MDNTNTYLHIVLYVYMYVCMYSDIVGHTGLHALTLAVEIPFKLHTPSRAPTHTFIHKGMYSCTRSL